MATTRTAPGKGAPLLLCLLLLQACKHPLVIEGEGDIIERLAGVRGCTLEEYQVGAARCVENAAVDDDYTVSYQALPRPGWVFVGWEGIGCGEVTDAGYCEWDLSRAWIDVINLASPFASVGATVAVFEQADADIAGISTEYTVSFDYTDGFDSDGSPSFLAALESRKLGVSSLSNCAFHYGRTSGDGSVSEEFPEGNYAFCAAQDGADVVGRIDFLEPMRSFTSQIVYFDDGVVTLEAYAADGSLLFSMADQYLVGFGVDDLPGGQADYVILRGNQNNAAINLDNLVLQTAGAAAANQQLDGEPLTIEAAGFEPPASGQDSWTTVRPQGGFGSAVAADDRGSVRYPLVFDTAGTYRLYLHARSIGAGSSNSLRVSVALDESPPSRAVEITPNNVFQWHYAGTYTIGTSDLGVVRNLYLEADQSGVQLDELVLMDTDAGPADLADLYERRHRIASANDREREFGWTQFRGNRELTGRNRVVGTFSAAPITLASTDISQWETTFTIDLDQRAEHTVAPPGGMVYGPDKISLQRDWSYKAEVLPLDKVSGEQSFYFNKHYQHGYYMPGYASVQEVSAGGENETISASYWNDGNWQEIWRLSGTEFGSVRQPIVGDFDIDGMAEVAFLPWNDVWVLDLATGNEEQVARFVPEASDNGRGYGWFGAADLFEDERKEFVVVADFHNHMEVLGWNSQGQLEKRWDWLIENGISNKQTMIHPGVNPIGDVIADNGTREIVVSVFNTEGKGRWRTLVIDPRDGTVIEELADVYLSRLFDINSDGLAELFLTPTRGRQILEDFGVSILSLGQGTAVTLLSTSEGSFAHYNLASLPDNVTTDTGRGTETVFIAEFDTAYPVFFTRDTSRTVLTAWQFNGDTSVAALGDLTGTELYPVGFDRSDQFAGDILLQRRVPVGDGAVTSDFATAIVYSERARRNGGAPLVAPAVDGRDALIAVDDGLGSVYALAFRDGGLVNEWDAKGRASAQGIVRGNAMLFADVSDETGHELIYAVRQADGRGAISAVSDGTAVWTQPFSGFQGWVPSWNENGVINWHAGYFTGGEFEDVAVSLRRSTMHSDETHLLDGSTGDPRWVRKAAYQGFVEPDRGRGVGGAWYPMGDFNGDGRDDLVSASDGVAVLDGLTGGSIAEKYSYEISGFQVNFNHGSLMMRDAQGVKEPVFYATEDGAYRLDESLAVRWRNAAHSLTQSSEARGAVADLDGDGIDELVLVGADWGEQIIALNNDGSLRWNVQRYQNQNYLAAADIDNDGRDEIIYAVETELVALEEREGAPAEMWRWQEPDGLWLNAPAIEDLDADGDLEIVALAEGRVHVLGSSLNTPLPSAPELKALPAGVEAGPVRVAWQLAAFATAYHVEVALDEEFTQVAERLTVPRDRTALELELEEGTFWLRVLATNPQGSAASTARAIQVSAAADRLQQD